MTYVLLSGASNTKPVLVVADPGTKIATLHPNRADFDVLSDAIEAAKAAGADLETCKGAAAISGMFIHPVSDALEPLPESIPDWDENGDYPEGAVVSHEDRYWVHISDQQGEPDEVYDAEAGTGDWVPVG